MRTDLVRELRCPADGASLGVQESGDAKGLLDTGVLQCASCHRSFSVTGGIADLRLLVGDEAVVAAKQKEIAVRDSEAHEIYDRIVGEYRTRLEIFYTLECLDDVAGKRVLDLGCGTGRITQALIRRGAQVIGVDYSVMSLREALARVGGDGRRLDLIAADMAALPFADGYFDLVVSSQVLEHLINAEQRRFMFQSIARVLRSGGKAFLTTYNYDRSMKKFLEPGNRQGYSSRGVPFYCHTKEELASDLSEFFTLRKLLCIDHQLVRAFPRRLGMPLGFWMDRLIALTPISWNTGHLLAALCNRNSNGSHG